MAVAVEVWLRVFDGKVGCPRGARHPQPNFRSHHLERTRFLPPRKDRKERHLDLVPLPVSPLPPTTTPQPPLTQNPVRFCPLLEMFPSGTLLTLTPKCIPITCPRNVDPKVHPNYLSKKCFWEHARCSFFAAVQIARLCLCVPMTIYLGGNMDTTRG